MTENAYLGENSPFEPKMAISRGVLIVDHDLIPLIPFLKQKNFKAHPLAKGIKDEQIVPILEHRVLVTNNSEDFREQAAIHEFSIIDTSGYFQGAPKLAKEISRCWSSLSLKRKQPFLLILRKEEEPLLGDLE